jgi:pyridoxine/pyridoxamine 5'-phosphate oxidase
VDVPNGFEDLFDDSSRAFLVLATMRKVAEPVVAPVWFVADESGLLFTSDNTAAKVRDIRARSKVAGIVMAERDYVRYVSVRGEAVEIVDPGAEKIDAQEVYRRIVRRYEGHDPREPFDGVLFRLVPRRFTGFDYHDLTV